MAGPGLPLRSARTIVLGLAMGVFAFAAVVVGLRLNGGSAETDEELTTLLALVLLAIAVALVPAYLVVRRNLLARVRADRAAALAELESERTPPLLFALALIGAALAEFAGLFGVVTLLLGGSWFLLAAPVLSVVLILAQVPSRERLERVVREGG